MLRATRDPRVGAPRWSQAWGLLALVGGALALVIIALIAIALGGRQQPELAPLSTPEGVVQHFFDATYRGDYATAYGMLSDTTRRERTLAEFQEQLRYQRDSELRVNAVAIHDQTATVTVTVTHFSPGGLFGGNEWSTQYDILLERDGETWRIIGWPFW